jgi:hypothetical protein
MSYSIKSTDVSFTPGFRAALNDANRRDDPFINQFRLMDDGSPIVGGTLDEFPKSINTQKKYLDQVLSDQSDRDKGAVDLDTAARNSEFLQVGIKNRVAKENMLSDQGIQLAQQIDGVNK